MIFTSRWSLLSPTQAGNKRRISPTGDSPCDTIQSSRRAAETSGSLQKPQRSPQAHFTPRLTHNSLPSGCYTVVSQLLTRNKQSVQPKLWLCGSGEHGEACHTLLEPGQSTEGTGNTGLLVSSNSRPTSSNQ